MTEFENLTDCETEHAAAVVVFDLKLQYSGEDDAFDGQSAADADVD